MTIGKVCHRQVVVARRDNTLKHAAELMRLHHVGDVVIVQDRDGAQVPVGLLTDRDIVVGVVAKGLEADKIEIGEVVSRDVVVAHEDLGIAEVVECMHTKGVRRMPIVNARGTLVGIVTSDDILGMLAEELSALARVSARQSLHEAGTRTA